MNQHPDFAVRLMRTVHSVGFVTWGHVIQHPWETLKEMHYTVLMSNGQQ